MQIGGINNNHSSYHHVTDCIHTRAASTKVGGAAADTSQSAPAQSQQLTSAQAEVQFSLATWLDKTWFSVKNLWGKIWGSGESEAGDGNEILSEGADGFGMLGASASLLGNTDSVLAEMMEEMQETALSAGASEGGTNGDVAAENASGSAMPETEDMIGTAQIAAASTAIVQPRATQDIPYFVTAENIDKQRETLWQRAKVRFKEVASQLMGQLPGRFAGFFAGSSFQTKQEQSREEMHRRSKARSEGAEFDSMAENDSHLMDSYDSSGNYRKLGEGVAGNISVRK